MCNSERLLNPWIIWISILVVCGVIGSPLGVGAQRRLIQDALTIIEEEGNLDSALVLLDSASNYNYGWCGNAWDNAFHWITPAKARIYTIQKKYQLALGELADWNSQLLNLSTIFGTSAKDSMKLDIMIRMHGKDCIRKLVLTSMDTVEISEIEYRSAVNLRFDSLNYTMSFVNENLGLLNFYHDTVRDLWVADPYISVTDFLKKQYFYYMLF